MEDGGRVQRVVAALLAVAFCLDAFGWVPQTRESAFGGPAYPVDIHTYSGQFDLRIPADPDSTKGWMSDAVVEVTDHLDILDLDVGLSLTHTKVFDLQIFLESPSGTRMCLNMYNPFDEYFEGEDYIGTVFDDEAGLPIEEASPPFTGRFRPMAGWRLDSFDGEDAFGQWGLQIYDAFHADVGRFGSYELVITVPEPSTAILLLIGAAWAARSSASRGRA